MYRKDANTARPLNGLQILDVGCGGGLVCEVSQRILCLCSLYSKKRVKYGHFKTRRQLMGTVRNKSPDSQVFKTLLRKLIGSIGGLR